MKNKIDCGCEKDVFACQTHVHPKHTPVPWRVAPDEPMIVETIAGKEIADCSLRNASFPSVENAAFIVRAVNAHEELVKALQGMMEWARRVKSINPGNEILNASNALLKAGDRHLCGDGMCEAMIEECENVGIPHKQAIAKAEGK